MEQFGTSANDSVRSLVADASGIYAGGWVNRGPGGDAFVAKMGSAGGLQWMKSFGTSGDDLTYAVASDATGVYAAGDQDYRAFLRKYDPGGALLWERVLSYSWVGRATAVASTGAAVYLAVAANSDFLLERYSTDGALVFSKPFGTTSGAIPFGIAVGEGAVFLVGYTDGALPGYTLQGFRDAFVVKYDLDGNVLWFRQFGTTSSDEAFAVAVDATGIYITGDTTGAFANATNAGRSDIFVRKYDLAGQERWTSQFGDMGMDEAYSISADAAGLYVGGSSYARLHLNGTLAWSRYVYGGNGATTYAMAPFAGGILLGGGVAGAFPGKASAGWEDAFVAQVALPEISPEPTAIAFGDVPFGRTPTKTLTLRSTGVANLTIARVRFERGGWGFSVSTPALPVVLPPGTSVNLTVSFTPPSLGPVIDWLWVDTGTGIFPSGILLLLSGSGVRAPPTAPRNLSASPAVGAISLTWEAPASDGGSPIQGYRVYRGPTADALTLLANLDGFRYLDDLASEGASYLYAVSALNAVGESSLSPTVGVVVPDITSPALRILSPANGSTMAGPNVTIVGTATDNVGVVRVEVSVDGSAWSPASGTSAWSVRLELAPGDHTVLVRAWDAAGNNRTASVSVTVSEPARAPDLTLAWAGLGAVVVVASIAAAFLWSRRRGGPGKAK